MGCVRARLILMTFVGVTLTACGVSATATSSPPGVSTTTTTVRPCGPSEEGCSSAQVIATVEGLYLKAGATPVEAKCIAPITGTGKSAVNEAFHVPKPGEEAAAIECVGSEERLRTIVDALAVYAEQHPFG